MKRIPTRHERRLEAFNPIKIIQLLRKPAVAPAKGNGLRGLSISKLACDRSQILLVIYLGGGRKISQKL